MKSHFVDILLDMPLLLLLLLLLSSSSAAYGSRARTYGDDDLEQHGAHTCQSMQCSLQFAAFNMQAI